MCGSSLALASALTQFVIACSTNVKVATAGA